MEVQRADFHHLPVLQLTAGETMKHFRKLWVFLRESYTKVSLLLEMVG